MRPVTSPLGSRARQPSTASRIPVVTGIALVALLLASANSAWANAGTPLVLTTVFHLLIGNALIGAVEGTVLSVFFHAGRLKCIGLGIVANYVSAWAGALTLDCQWIREHVISRVLGQSPIYGVTRTLVVMGVALFLSSVVLEWPFYRLALGRRPGGWRTSAFASTIAQALSYVVLVPVYIASSDLSLITSVHLDPTLAFARKTPAWLYYIDRDTGTVQRVRLDGTERSKIADMSRLAADGRLIARKSHEGAPWDLWCSSTPDGTKGLQGVIVLEAFARGPVSEFEGEEEEDEDADLRPVTARQWRVASPAHPHDGLAAWNAQDDSQRFDLSLDAPGLAWHTDLPSLLPNDLMVFGIWGHASGTQIVVLDLKTRHMGLLARGDGWLIALDDSQANTASSLPASPQPTREPGGM